MAATYSELPSNLVSAANGIDYAYREAGEGAASSREPARGRAGFPAHPRQDTGPGQGNNLANTPGPVRRRLRLGIPNHALLQRLSTIDLPVFVANGDSDPMILPHYSYLLAGLIPQARVKICPDSAHGFLFQYHAEFAD